MPKNQRHVQSGGVKGNFVGWQMSEVVLVAIPTFNRLPTNSLVHLAHRPLVVSSHLWCASPFCLSLFVLHLAFPGLLMRCSPLPWRSFLQCGWVCIFELTPPSTMFFLIRILQVALAISCKDFFLIPNDGVFRSCGLPYFVPCSPRGSRHPARAEEPRLPVVLERARACRAIFHENHSKQTHEFALAQKNKYAALDSGFKMGIWYFLPSPTSLNHKKFFNDSRLPSL